MSTLRKRQITHDACACDVEDDGGHEERRGRNSKVGRSDKEDNGRNKTNDGSSKADTGGHEVRRGRTTEVGRSEKEIR